MSVPGALSRAEPLHSGRRQLLTHVPLVPTLSLDWTVNTVTVRQEGVLRQQPTPDLSYERIGSLCCGLRASHRAPSAAALRHGAD